MLRRFSFCLSAVIAFAGVAVPAHADDIRSTGTAFAISRDGWLLTNAHVIDKCTEIEVKGLGRATGWNSDATNDLGVIRVSTSQPLAPLRIRESAVRLGEDIVAVGYPLADLLSDNLKVTTGNVNALAGIMNDTRYLQISTPIQPGNSGGPLLDEQGLLLGIVTATLSKTAEEKLGISAQNVNFAMRITVAESFLQSQGITYDKAASTSDSPTLKTADIAEKVAPSVFQVACYGSVATAARPTETAPATETSGTQSASSLISASGYDAIGYDYRMLENLSYGDCENACRNDGRCRALTYNTRHSACFLKSETSILIRNGDAVAAYDAQDQSKIIYSGMTSYTNIDLPGGDYRRLRKVSYLTCLVECLKENQCLAFAFVRKKAECWLKDRLGAPRNIRGIELGVK